MIGERLRRTRAAKGLSLRALSDQIGNRVSGQAIGKYERDEDMPSSDVLIALARALGVSPDHLASAPDLELEGVEFRKEIASARREQEIEGRALHAVERYLAVEDLLGLRSVDWQLPRGAPYPVGDLRDAEDAARSVRREWTLGNDPIPNLAELLEERGVKVLSLNLDSIDGLAAQVRRRGASRYASSSCGTTHGPSASGSRSPTNSGITSSISHREFPWRRQRTGSRARS